MSYEVIIYEKEDAIAIVTLNRPAKRNALSLQLVRELSQAFKEMENDDSIKVLIITGGPDCFSSGADLTETPQSAEVRRERRAVYSQIRNFEKPIIAVIRGWCLAGGLEIAMSCDIRIASETAKIGERHIQIGTIGGGGSLALLPRLVGVAKAKELTFTGDPIDGKEAFRIGLVNHVFPQEVCFEEAMRLARRIAEMPPHISKLAKKGINWGMDIGLSEAVQLSNLSADLADLAPEASHGIEAFLTKEGQAKRVK